MIDLHSHILPGLDDGAQSLEDAHLLADAALGDGTSQMAATPHVRDDFPTTAGAMEEALAGLRRDFDERGVPLGLVAGGEISLEHLSRLPAEDLVRFSLAQTGRYLLVEFPYFGWPLSIASEISRLRRLGLTAILAHPERNADVQENPTALGPLVELGALVQLTAASVDGRLGRRSKRAAEALLGAGLAHLIASDSHGLDLRAPGLSGAVRAIRDRSLARYLTEEVPAAIVAGDAAPIRSRRR